VGAARVSAAAGQLLGNKTLPEESLATPVIRVERRTGEGAGAAALRYLDADVTPSASAA
jgi:hypothetical protein